MRANVYNIIILGVLLATLLVIPLSIIMATLNSSPEFTQLEIVLDIQRDGSVIVTHIVNVTVQCVYIDIPAISKPLEPVFAVGKEVYDTSVEVSDKKYIIRVYAPDRGVVNVTYLTDTLVYRKPPNIWSLNVTIPCTTRIILPENSIPLDIPEEFIDLYEVDKRYVLLLPPGDYVVKWLLRVYPPVLIPKAKIISVKYPSEVQSNSKFALNIKLTNSGNRSGDLFIKIYDTFKGIIINTTILYLEVRKEVIMHFNLTSPKVSRNTTYTLDIICGHDDTIDDKKSIDIKVFVKHKLIPKIKILKIYIKDKVSSGEEYSIRVAVVNEGNKSATVFIRLYDKLKGTKLSDKKTLKPNEKAYLEIKLKAPSVDKETEIKLLLECGYDEKIIETRSLILKVLPRQPINTIFVLIGVLVAILSVLISFVVLRAKRRREYSELRYILTDIDVQIIRLLKSRSGEMLQRDIVSALRIPKTTAHRHLKKLEKYGIVKIERIGMVNVVRLIKKLRV